MNRSYSYINISATLFTIVINTYINYIYYDNYETYIYKNFSYNMIPIYYAFYFWFLIYFIILIGLIASICEKNNNYEIVSYFLSCILNCLYHYYLRKNLIIGTIILFFLIISLIINILELYSINDTMITISTFFVYLLWCIYILILNMSCFIDDRIDNEVTTIILNVSNIIFIFLASFIYLFYNRKNIIYLKNSFCLAPFIFLIIISILFNNIYNYFTYLGLILAFILGLYHIYLYRKLNRQYILID